MNDRLDIPGVPPDWPHDPAASALAPEWFHELIAERGGPAPIIAISTADTPSLPSIYDGRSVVEQVAQLYRRLADLPPAIERISVHPGEIDAFVAGFPKVQLPWPGFSADTLLKTPIVTDPKVPPNTVRVRRGGEERDYPFRSPPRPRRVPWWRRWTKSGRRAV